jgi:aspartyl protease family protein
MSCVVNAHRDVTLSSGGSYAVLLWICLSLLVLGGIAAFVFQDAHTLGGLSGDTLAGVAAGLALLVFYVSAISSDYRGRIRGMAKDFFLWAGLALLLIVAYSFRNEAMYVITRVAGELMPPGQAINISTMNDGKHVVRIRRRPDNHFAAAAQVNGFNVSMLVDTGASTIVLRPTDARTAGINTANLSFTVPVNTANGAAFAASVKLREIRIGPIVMRNIEALVSKPGTLKESLLGMNFLRRLRSYEFSGEFLTLRG